MFGWSWGGIVALGLALEHRELVQRLVVCEPPLQVKRHMTFDHARRARGRAATRSLSIRELARAIRACLA